MGLVGREDGGDTTAYPGRLAVQGASEVPKGAKPTECPAFPTQQAASRSLAPGHHRLPLLRRLISLLVSARPCPESRGRDGRAGDLLVDALLNGVLVAPFAEPLCSGQATCEAVEVVKEFQDAVQVGRHVAERADQRHDVLVNDAKPAR